MRLIRLRGKTEMKRPENQTPTRGAGFTLIELMIVVAIIGILATIAIPKFAGLIRKSSEGQTKGNLGALRSVVSIYYGENETYPAPSASGDTSVGVLWANCSQCRTANTFKKRQIVIIRHITRATRHS